MGFQGWTNQLVDVPVTKGLLDQLVRDLEGLAGRGTQIFEGDGTRPRERTGHCRLSSPMGVRLGRKV